MRQMLRLRVKQRGGKKKTESNWSEPSRVGEQSDSWYAVAIALKGGFYESGKRSDWRQRLVHTLRINNLDDGEVKQERVQVPEQRRVEALGSEANREAQFRPMWGRKRIADLCPAKPPSGQFWVFAGIALNLRTSTNAR